MPEVKVPASLVLAAPMYREEDVTASDHAGNVPAVELESVVDTPLTRHETVDPVRVYATSTTDPPYVDTSEKYLFDTSPLVDPYILKYMYPEVSMKTRIPPNTTEVDDDPAPNNDITAPGLLLGTRNSTLTEKSPVPIAGNDGT